MYLASEPPVESKDKISDTTLKDAIIGRIDSLGLVPLPRKKRARKGAEAERCRIAGDVLDELKEMFETGTPFQGDLLEMILQHIDADDVQAIESFSEDPDAEIPDDLNWALGPLIEGCARVHTLQECWRIGVVEILKAGSFPELDKKIIRAKDPEAYDAKLKPKPQKAPQRPKLVQFDTAITRYRHERLGKTYDELAQAQITSPTHSTLRDSENPDDYALLQKAHKDLSAHLDTVQVESATTSDIEMLAMLMEDTEAILTFGHPQTNDEFWNLLLPERKSGNKNPALTQMIDERKELISKAKDSVKAAMRKVAAYEKAKDAEITGFIDSTFTQLTIDIDDFGNWPEVNWREMVELARGLSRINPDIGAYYEVKALTIELESAMRDAAYKIAKSAKKILINSAAKFATPDGKTFIESINDDDDVNAAFAKVIQFLETAKNELKEPEEIVDKDDDCTAHLRLAEGNKRLAVIDKPVLPFRVLMENLSNLAITLKENLKSTIRPDDIEHIRSFVTFSGYGDENDRLGLSKGEKTDKEELDDRLFYARELEVAQPMWQFAVAAREGKLFDLYVNVDGIVTHLAELTTNMINFIREKTKRENKNASVIEKHWSGEDEKAVVRKALKYAESALSYMETGHPDKRAEAETIVTRLPNEIPRTW